MLAWLAFLSILGTCVAATWDYPSGDDQPGWMAAPCTAGPPPNATHRQKRDHAMSRQSPIDINCTMPATVVAPMSYKNYFVNKGKNNKWHKGLLHDNGHTVQWTFGENETCQFDHCHGHGKCPSIQNGPFGANCTDQYYLAQLHFHWGKKGPQMAPIKGSEHRLCNESFPLEMHMVHVNKKFVDDSGCVDWTGATTDPKGLAVLGIFFCIDPDRHKNQNPLSYVSDVASGVKGPARMKREADSEDERPGGGHPEEQLRTLQEAMEELDANNHARIRSASDSPKMKLRLNPGGFIRKVTLFAKCRGDCSTYYTYEGSLTTPGCNEVVTWVVFECCLTITQVQMNAFAHRYEDNFRDIDTCAACQANADPAMNHLKHLIHNEIPFPKAGIFG